MESLSFQTKVNCSRLYPDIRESSEKSSFTSYYTPTSDTFAMLSSSWSSCGSTHLHTRTDHNKLNIQCLVKGTLKLQLLGISTICTLRMPIRLGGINLCATAYLHESNKRSHASEIELTEQFLNCTQFS